MFYIPMVHAIFNQLIPIRIPISSQSHSVELMLEHFFLEEKANVLESFSQQFAWLDSEAQKIQTMSFCYRA